MQIKLTSLRIDGLFSLVLKGLFEYVVFILVMLGLVLNINC